MSGDVRLSDRLFHIKSLMVQQNLVTATCSLCEKLRQRCAELEFQIGDLQSVLLSKTSTPQGNPDKRLVNVVDVVSDDMLVSHTQENTNAAIDSGRSHSGCSSPFSLLNSSLDHEMIVTEDEDSEMLLQSSDSIQPSTNCGQSENNHLCDQTCASVSQKFS